MDKDMIDGLSIATVVATVVGWLPAIASLVSIIWVCIRIYETKTIRGWLRKNEEI